MSDIIKEIKKVEEDSGKFIDDTYHFPERFEYVKKPVHSFFKAAVFRATPKITVQYIEGNLDFFSRLRIDASFKIRGKWKRTVMGLPLKKLQFYTALLEMYEERMREGKMVIPNEQEALEGYFNRRKRNKIFQLDKLLPKHFSGKIKEEREKPGKDRWNAISEVQKNERKKG